MPVPPTQDGQRDVLAPRTERRLDCSTDYRLVSAQEPLFAGCKTAGFRRHALDHHDEVRAHPPGATGRTVVADVEERRANPRSRSAKLRVAVRLPEPASTDETVAYPSN